MKDAEAKEIISKLHFETYFKLCIRDVSGRTVENKAEIMADKKDKKFTESEIALMKELKLQDMIFSDTHDLGKFKIGKAGDEAKFIRFSNRISSNKELRGEFLRGELEKLKKDNDSMTLYDALHELVSRPELMLDVFLMTIASSRGYRKIMPGKEFYEPTRNALIKLAEVCISYVDKKEESGVLPIHSLSILKNFLTREDEHEKKEKVVTLALNGGSKEDIYASLCEEVKQSEIRRKGIDWIDKIYELAKKYPHNEKTLKELAGVAESILNFNTDYQSDINNSKIEEFDLLLDQAKQLLVYAGKANYLKSFIVKVPNIELEIDPLPNILKSNFKKQEENISRV